MLSPELILLAFGLSSRSFSFAPCTPPKIEIDFRWMKILILRFCCH
jgi:hypothetical protein